jgi:hypothetical protein
VAGRIKSMNISGDIIGNLTRDLSDYGAVFQPTAPLRVLGEYNTET